MSKIALQGNVAGSGTFTLAAPNSDSSYTLNLPQVSGGTLLASDASGNVGIGTSAPNIGGTSADNSTLTLKGKAATRSGIIEFANYGTTGDNQTLGWTRYFDGSTENASIEVARASNTSTANIKFSTNGGSGNTERMRIDSNGKLLVGATSAGFGVFGAEFHTMAGRLTIKNTVNTSQIVLWNSAGTSGYYEQVSFSNNAGTAWVGSINRVNDNSVQYNTSSDYRLKENIQPMQNALETVSLLNPVTYNWKSDGSDGQGFIAHELQAVVPDCVTGEKDAVDAEGNPVYQGIDTSFLVATLTKAIQEQQEQINELKAQVAALTKA